MSSISSPFKFLDAYGYEDYRQFFGREEEIDVLYDILRGVKHLLVYGPTGSGKTSLIECGLRNQYSKADWYALTIRRGDQMLRSFYETINAQLQKPIAIDAETGLPQEENIDFSEMTRLLFEDKYTPVYLIFDQFEELLLLGSPEEQRSFFVQLNELVHARLPCRVLLVMREEFIGHLSAFEHLMPGIFEHRYRLEKMGRRKVRQVLQQLLNVPAYQEQYNLQDGDLLVDEMLRRLPDQQYEIELTHVQVFLHELWKRAVQQSKTNLPTLSANLIRKDDKLGAVLNDFLNQQLAEMKGKLPQKLPLEILSVMVSERHTKLQLTITDIEKELRSNEVENVQHLPSMLEELERRRIIRATKSGDTTRFEISHDLLALAVGENLTDDIRQRQKAVQTYKVYQEREGYFSRDEIAHLALFTPYRSLPTKLEQRVTASQTQLEREEQKELFKSRRRFHIVSGLLLLFVIASIVALLYYQQSEKQRLIVVDKNYELQWRLAQIRKVSGDYEGAQKVLKILLSTIQEPVQKTKIEDSIAVWQELNVLVETARKYETARKDTSAIFAIKQAISLSGDEHLQSLLLQFKKQFYERLLSEAYTIQALKRFEELQKVIAEMEAIGFKSEAEIRKDLENPK